MMVEKALAPGTIIKGEKNSYRVTELLRSNGQGFTYKVTTTVGVGPRARLVSMVMREHMMVRCSDRADDGVTVVTAEDIAPTVESCMRSFAHASEERARVAERCPWLIDVIDIFEANNTYYYVAEFLDGPNLQEYVESRGGRLTYEDAKEVLSPIFDATRALHSNRILHTNITPRHIKFVKTAKGMTPVLFSLYDTMHFGEKGVESWMLPVMSCTEGYAPPEQYSIIEHFYTQIDVYALAATLVYALTGTNLPDSRTLTPDMVREILPSALPETLVSAIINALDPDINQRTASVTNFREELQEFNVQPYKDTRVKSRDLAAEEEEENTPFSFSEMLKNHWWKFLIGAVMLGAIIKVIVS
ncbi:MAG: hypothetical protein K2K77_04910, partial [Duncaniella sp.]|nr:hypothetical protein [Duncaniella sp.]